VRTHALWGLTPADGSSASAELFATRPRPRPASLTHFRVQYARAKRKRTPWPRSAAVAGENGAYQRLWRAKA
jgi:hypothetical protein